MKYIKALIAFIPFIAIILLILSVGITVALNSGIKSLDNEPFHQLPALDY